MLRKGLVIYAPKGRAGEYAPLAVNLYRGCGHGCEYCYGPASTFMDPKEFVNPTPRPGIIEKLQKDAPIAAKTYEGEDKTVLLCFTCDPYQSINEIHQLTRQAIHILHASGFAVNILTKGGSRAINDLRLLQDGDSFATTLTFLDREKSSLWEPGAAEPIERINTMKVAHAMGIKTWVSLEPVLEPSETLEIIRQTHTFVDLFKVGKLNHHPLAGEIDWHKFAKDSIIALEEYGCQYYLKNDLRRYL